MSRYLHLILAVFLVGCANTPMSVDLSQSEHLLQSRSSQSKATVSNVSITNKAEKTKLVNTPLGSDTFFPFNTDIEIRKTVEADIRNFFDQALDKSQKTSRSLVVTIYKADGYWVWGGDLPPASRTKVMAVSPQILENCGYEDHTIYR